MSVSYLNICQEHAGQRVDNYLVAKLKGVPRSKIYNILRKGEVRVNKGRVKPCYKLQVDDELRIPPIRVATTDSLSVAKNIGEVLFENEHLLIINKPAGLAVHGGSGLKHGLIESCRQIYKNPNLELIHRIDRDTSGCVMIAKTRKMLRAMHDLMQNNKIQKDYHVLVKGYVACDFTVKDPLRKNILKSGERIVKVDLENGQSAITKFILVERYKSLSLLQAKLLTGRTHQIRVHCASRNLPIVGDDKYGDKGLNQQLRKHNLKRMYLHARQLVFDCPLSGENIAITASYDTDWQKGIEQWQKS